MTNLVSRLDKVKKALAVNYWSERLISEIEFAYIMDDTAGGKHKEQIEHVLQYVEECCQKDGDVLKRSAVLEAEDQLMPLSKEAKAYKIICPAHAHIDMNWMWGWDETVAVTLDTFRTMLDLMVEYPDFKFSQSQASIYEIVETYAPEMLEEIKLRVQEGRWEITATHWVEADKNMPNGESFARHILYTKRYLSNLFEIDPSSLNIDFEPDTFGHSANVPEILNQGGIDYYYHCRGYDGHSLYRWRSPSGAEVIAYREPIWYNAEIDPTFALHAPHFFKTHGTKTMMKVFGVGDHGGGPTRRDLEKIKDMNSWPVFPEIKFGTYKEFFETIEPLKDQLPVVEGELNFVFTGCYTTQSRIKKGNRLGEVSLNEAEIYNSLSKLYAGGNYLNDHFFKAWKNVLFNQFHDILPGSGVVETREYAMGKYQETLSMANSRRSEALRRISNQIHTKGLIVEGDLKSVSEGAGVGFSLKKNRLLNAERGRGKERIFHVFNSASFPRKENVELVVWDWQGDLEKMCFINENGVVVSHQLMDSGWNSYWGHSYVKVLVSVDVPGFGYGTYVMKEQKPKQVSLTNPFHDQPRVEPLQDYVLENNFIKATFSSVNFDLISLIDKSTNVELIDRSKGTGAFRFIEEDDERGMTAWIVGRYQNIELLGKGAKLKRIHNDPDSLRQFLEYEFSFKDSKLMVTVSLDANSFNLEFDVTCDWREVGEPQKLIPQLNFFLPLAYSSKSYVYDNAFGTVERPSLNMDVPGNCFMVACNEALNQKSVLLLTDSKNGFRGRENSMAITLLRSSYDPDPYPEFGIHEFSFAVCLLDASSRKKWIDRAYCFNHPLQIISGKPHEGKYPLSNSFLSIKSNHVVVSAVKSPEDSFGNDVIIRLYETQGESGPVTVTLNGSIESASLVDLNENPFVTEGELSISENEIHLVVRPYSLLNIKITIK